MLIALYYSKKITDADLQAAKAMIPAKIRRKKSKPKDPTPS
jgi:aromatic ring hydroxylase